MIYFKKKLNVLEKWVFHSHFWKFHVIILFLAILRNGIWFVPNIEAVRYLSIDLTKNGLAHIPDAHYLLSSFLGPVLAHFFRLNTNSLTFGLFHLSLFFVGYFLVIYYCKKNLNDFISRIFAICFVASPISTTIFTWLGTSDSIVFLLSTALIVIKNPFSLILLGFFQGINHFEQGFFIFLFTLIVSYFGSKISYFPNFKYILYSFLGLLAGKVSLLSWFYINAFNVQNNRLDFIIKLGLQPYFKNFLVHFNALTFSLFNVLWVPILYFFIQTLDTKYIKIKNIFILVFLIALSVTFIAYDSTRVFSLISWNVILLYFIFNFSSKNFDQHETQTLFSITLLALFFLPPLMIWEGKIHGSALFYTMKSLYKFIVHGDLWTPEIASWVLQPFR